MPFTSSTIRQPEDSLTAGVATQAEGVIRFAVEASEMAWMGETAHVLCRHLNQLVEELHYEGADNTVEDLVRMALLNGLSPMGFRDPR